MRARWFDLADGLFARRRAGELILLFFEGEESDFIRFSQSRVRQAGHVAQANAWVRLIRGGRQAAGQVTLTGRAGDARALARELAALRALLPALPEDPHLLVSTEVRSSDDERPGALPPPGRALRRILAAGRGRDMVGIYAGGRQWRAFANSLGQRNAFARDSFHLDWTFYHRADKAAKGCYAGFAWDDAAFESQVAAAAEAADLLRREPMTLAPGEYRTYLAPAALAEILRMLGWGGFSLKAQRTKQSPLLRLVEGEETLAPGVTLREHTAGGLAPAFGADGFLKPAEVPLIRAGRHAGALVAPRSAREYGVPTTGGGEYPEALDLAGGALAPGDVLARLGRGVYVNTLWYLNYSDRLAGRITGMTRFATFWVEDGRLVAPLNVMRFDDTIYRMLGSQLVDLTAEPQFLPDGHTYFQRSTASTRTPGALIDGFRLTL